MVMELVRTGTQHEVSEIATRLGIKVKILPWWGSVRRQYFGKHKGCGGRITEFRFCLSCLKEVPRCEIDSHLITGERICPASASYNQIKRPEIRQGIVFLWEGQCHFRQPNWIHGHIHSQKLEVIDVGETAFLLQASIGKVYTRFLIGLDDAHPFIVQGIRRLNTVQDVFDWLVPKKVQEAMIMGKDVKRQGDWFFVPYEREPNLFESESRLMIVLAHRARNSYVMHRLYRGARLVYGNITRHTGQIVVYKSQPGLPYPCPIVKGDVKAPDHPTLHLETWHVGIRVRTSPGVGNLQGGD